MGYSKALVAFIDILGSKQINSFDLRLSVNMSFHTELEKFMDVETVFDSIKKYERQVYVFSDCCYIIFYYNDAVSHKDDFKLIKNGLHYISLLALEILSNNVIIRGGITFGDVYFEKDRSLFFGPAIDCAYQLESKVAVVPRIAIDEKIASDYIRNENDFIDSAPENQKEIIKKINGDIIEQENDVYYLNIFDHLNKQTILPSGISVEEIAENLLTLSKKTIEAKNEEKCVEVDANTINETEKILIKHNWLINYIENKIKSKKDCSLFLCNEDYGIFAELS